mmetsp:Transcript_31986/g.98717  ORF Transcript_31986/g.98717 Transcript_31986/m.98717 type:complete len:102 (+) Transcript_31986:704-1009(+)
MRFETLERPLSLIESQAGSTRQLFSHEAMPCLAAGKGREIARSVSQHEIVARALNSWLVGRSSRQRWTHAATAAAVQAASAAAAGVSLQGETQARKSPSSP